MCFSAVASFSASIVLGVIGVVAVKKVTLPSQLAFACMPLLFSFQQFIEGILWLSLSNKEFSFLEPISTYLFLIIAQIIWPTWVPLSIMFLEKDVKRKKALYIILGVGIILSTYLTFCFLFYNVLAEISNNHIEYKLDFPHSKHLLWLTGLFYFIPTVVSTFISSVKRMQILGMTILVSCVLTRLFTLKYFISLWCFFAAIISVLILLIMIKLQKSTKWAGWLHSLRS
ncbi:MAG: hypothetical protein H0W84_07860 [Bacteroidetes bacterium]|nr:hypothetical protein [Bacteroidota bacterium]